MAEHPPLALAFVKTLLEESGRDFVGNHVSRVDEREHRDAEARDRKQKPDHVVQVVTPAEVAVPLSDLCVLLSKVIFHLAAPVEREHAHRRHERARDVYLRRR